MRTRVIGLLTGVLMMVAGLVAPAPSVATPRPLTAAKAGRAPADYTKTKGLSAPRFDTVRETYEVEMEDGVRLYVEVERPDAPGRFPVVMEISPYHGTSADRDGTRILPGPKAGGAPIGLTGYFAPRGYAVAIVDLRGTGRSEGCLDHMGPKDQSDSKEIVEWAADQKWSSGRVGITGHSYVGSTPQMAAAQKPKGLATIVPSAGLAAMYHHEFQLGVPYYLQWAGPLFAYEQLAVERHLPGGDNSGNGMQYFGCGATQSAAVTGEAYLSGAEVDWHRERDFRRGATKAKIPVFIVHGVNDNAARIAAIDWFNARKGRPGDKAWIGQWDHGSGVFPNDRTCAQGDPQPCTNDQWTAALHAWFDKHLQKRDVDTGPPVEVFLNDGRVFTPAEWPPKASKLRLYPDADGSLASLPGTGSVSYIADARGFSNENNTGRVVFETEPLQKDTLLVGIPKLNLGVSILGGRTHVIATMYDVNGSTSDRIGRAGFAINPELREGIDNWQPIIPAQPMQIDMEGMGQAHLIPKGHVLRLIVASSHPDKVPTFATGSQVTVLTGGEVATTLTIPVITNYRLFPDPMGPH